MPRNGSGSFSLVSGNPVVPSTVISTTWANNTLSDIGTAITQSIANDGQTVPVANLPMAGFRHTNVANAQTRNEYASAAQVQDASLQWLTSISGADTITASLTPSPTVYVAGQVFRFVTAGTNTTTAPTLNVNGLGAKTLTKRGTLPLVIGEMVSGQIVEVAYDGTRFQLLGAVPSGALIGVQLLTASGTYTPTAGTNSVIVEIQAAGGGGGGLVQQTSGGGNASQGGGGGGYIKHRMTSGFSGATVTVGAGGTGGLNSGAAGGTGGNSAFAGVTANGGVGGSGIATSNGTATWSNQNSTLGGTASGGNIVNRKGMRSYQGGYGGTNHALFPNGAPSLFGNGGDASLNSDAGGASGYGAGGGGIIGTTADVASRTGGAGGPGFVLVWEYA